MLKPYPKGINTGGGTGCIEPYDPAWPNETEHGGNLKPLGMKPIGI